MSQTDTLKPRDAAIIAKAAEGGTCREIAKDPAVDVGYRTVNRITNKHKELIQAQSARIIENTLARIADRTIKEIDLAATLADNQLLNPVNQSALARIDKKEETILKSVGIAPSHAPSIHVQNIFNDNRKTILSPGVASLLHGKLDEIIDGEVIEEGEG